MVALNVIIRLRIEARTTSKEFVMTSLIYRYWGKAKPASEDAAPFHLLPFHCLAVAVLHGAGKYDARFQLKSTSWR